MKGFHFGNLTLRATHNNHSYCCYYSCYETQVIARFPPFLRERTLAYKSTNSKLPTAKIVNLTFLMRMFDNAGQQFASSQRIVQYFLMLLGQQREEQNFHLYSFYTFNLLVDLLFFSEQPYCSDLNSITSTWLTLCGQSPKKMTIYKTSLLDTSSKFMIKKYDLEQVKQTQELIN